MSYRIVKIHDLMTDDFSCLEADFQSLSSGEFEGKLLAGISFTTLVQQLKDGELGLLTNEPSTPMLTKFGGGWAVSEMGREQLSDVGVVRLQQRTSMTSNSSAFYRPIIPESMSSNTQPLVQETDEAPELVYEYSFEIFGDQQTLKQFVGVRFELAKTKQEKAISSWQIEQTEQGIRYKALCSVNEPKQLQLLQANAVIEPRLPEYIQPVDIGTSSTNDAFIPVLPTLAIESRIGCPTEGYIYHFNERVLVQEYKLAGGNNSTFFATNSTHERLDGEKCTSASQSAMLLFWRINGEVAANQHVIYLNQQITREELDNLDDEWLNTHGIPIDIDTLIQAPSQTVEAREEVANPYVMGKPPIAPQQYNCVANVHYCYRDLKLMGAPMRAIRTEQALPTAYPVVNLTNVPFKDQVSNVGHLSAFGSEMSGASAIALVGRSAAASPITWEVAIGAGEVVLEGAAATAAAVASAPFWVTAGVVVGVAALGVLIWHALDDEDEESVRFDVAKDAQGQQNILGVRSEGGRFSGRPEPKKIPVEMLEDGSYQVVIEEDWGKYTITGFPIDPEANQPKVYETPIVEPDMVDNIWITPEFEEDLPEKTETIPESQDWREYILVFPADSPIKEAYVVLSTKAGDWKYVPAPKLKTIPPLPAFPDARRVKSKGTVQGGGSKRERWKDKKRIYEWDSEGGKVEVYDKNGNHLGEFDHITGEQTKPRNKKRKVEK